MFEIISALIPFLLLGLTLLGTSTVWCIILVIAASPLGCLLRNNQTIGSGLNKICGTIFVGLAIKIGL